MESNMIRLTREQLFEMVWATPMQRLAKDFGLSDVGLAKLCRRNEIPVPGRGHWQRLEAGQNPERPGLPPLKRPEYGRPIQISHWDRFNDSVDQELANAKAQEPKNKPVSRFRSLARFATLSQSRPRINWCVQRRMTGECLTRSPHMEPAR